MSKASDLTGSFHSDIPEGSYIRMSGNRMKTLCRVESVNSSTEMTVRWVWWLESWFQYGAIAMVWVPAILSVL